MNRAAVCVFNDRPWERVIQEALDRSLKDEMETVHIQGYPPEGSQFDYLFLVGIRPVIKLGLDGERLRKHAKYLIDFGDVSSDPRVNVEDRYFYFYEDGPRYADHYRKLPKFVFEDLLYPEQDDDVVTVFVDHYLDRNSYHALVAEQIGRCPYPLRVFYQSKDGIVENPDAATLSSTFDARSEDFKTIPFEDIAPYYRKTHIFLPTHRETQGMVAIEIGACGGLTCMKPGTYPQSVQQTFSHVLYDEDHPIDWEEVRNYIRPELREKFRDIILGGFAFSHFKAALLAHLKELED